jgi:hypothetical protein
MTYMQHDRGTVEVAYCNPNSDAELAEGFGDLVCQRIADGTSVEAIEMWARVAARYGLRALETQLKWEQYAAFYADELLRPMTRR